MKIANVHWSKRPAVLVTEGVEQSVIRWMDSGIEQAVSNSQITIMKSDKSFQELHEKHAEKRKGPPRRTQEGPTKQDRVNELVAANPTKTRQELIALVIEQVGMTPAGAGTYVYNAQKSLKK